MAKCKTCGSDLDKVIYAGFPAKLCSNRECNTLWGMCADVIYLFPFNGIFFYYDDNYFFFAIWRWLFTDWENKEEE